MNRVRSSARCTVRRTDTDWQWLRRRRWCIFPRPPSYTLGGTVKGLAGYGLMLQNNGVNGGRSDMRPTESTRI